MRPRRAAVIASLLVFMPDLVPELVLDTAPGVASHAVAAMAASLPWRGLVLVLSPPVDDELTRNATLRIAGEFGAALFQVVTRPMEPGVDMMAQIDRAGSDLSPVAVFAIVRDPDEGSAGVAVWVSNRMTRTTTVQRVQIRSGNGERAAAQLAVETVDFLRASLPGLWPLDLAGRTADGRDVAGGLASDGTAASPDDRHLRLAVGAGLLAGFDSVPASWSPEIALTYGRLDRVGVRVTLAGLGPGASVTAADGTGARLDRAMLSLGLVRLFRADHRVQPLLSGAVGVHHLGAQGTGAAADREHDGSAFSALVSAGGGLAVALGSHLALTAEAEGLVTWPSVIVRSGNTDVAHLNRPSLFAHAGMLATF
jgi:hypothetical protein